MRIDMIAGQPAQKIPKVEGAGKSAEVKNRINGKSGRDTQLEKTSANDDKGKKNGKKSVKSPVTARKDVQYKVCDGDRVVIQLVDKETNKVVEEIPPEKKVEELEELSREETKKMEKKV